MQQAQSWKWLLTRGLFGILFGILVFFWPLSAAATLAYLFAVYVVIAGVLFCASSYEFYREARPWGFMLFNGIVGIGAGVMSFILPALLVISLIYLIAAWALVTGFVEIAFAIRGYVDGHLRAGNYQAFLEADKPKKAK
jgi:uncharacterized membrane protein HdeD (DUF308 family)